MEYNKNKKNFREKGDRNAQESSDGNVIVGRNPVLELLKSGRGIEKIYIQKGEREGSVTKIYAEIDDLVDDDILILEKAFSVENTYNSSKS